MASREEIMKLFKEYAPRIRKSIQMREDVSSKKIKTAIRSYAHDADIEKVLGMVNAAFFGSGSSGDLFTEDAYYFHFFDCDGAIHYDRVSRVEKSGKNHIRVYSKNGDDYKVFSPLGLDDYDALVEYLNKMIELVNMSSTVDERSILMAFTEEKFRELCRAGSYHDLIHLLKQEHVSPSKTLSEGDSLLRVAALENSRTDIFKALLDFGVDVNARNETGRTALTAAVGGKTEELAFTMTKFLIDSGANVNTKTTDDAATPLMFASQAPYKSVIRLLLENGADINETNDLGMSALMYAIANIDRARVGEGRGATPDTAKYLINNGANINITCGSTHMTPLMYSAITNLPEVAELLIACGANINIEDDDGYTAIYYAKQKKSYEIIRMLENPIPIIERKEKILGADIAGIVFGDISAAGIAYGLDKFNTPRGHGFAAERANHLYDKLTGHNAQIVGDDNAVNGADRLVDGVYIQSKYCASGGKCISECFDVLIKMVNSVITMLTAQLCKLKFLPICTMLLYSLCRSV